MTRAKKYQTEQNFLCAIGPKHLRTAVQTRRSKQEWASDLFSQSNSQWLYARFGRKRVNKISR